jgi:glycine/D-amino acid oxidase-like deaminating enzyme
MEGDPRSHGLWEKTAPLPPETSALTGDIRAEVAIIGGGFTGLSCALHLAQGGVEPVVLEAKEIGFGASGRNVGLLNAGLWMMPDLLKKNLGEVHGERVLGLLGEGPQYVSEIVERHGISCELTRNGTLHCGVGSRGLAELTQRHMQWKARGAPVELLDAQEAASAIGGQGYSSALLDRRAGTIQPLAYVRGLAAAAIKAGAKVFTHSAVASFKEQSGGWQLRTANGSVTARWLVLATDAYSIGPSEELRREQIHLPYFNFSTKPLSHNLRSTILPDRQGVWDTATVMSSFRFDQQGRLIFGSIGALRGTGAQVHKAWTIRAMRKMFPQLEEIEFDTEWFGMIGMTSDHLPRLHKAGPNVMSISGYNGRGISPGTVFGKALADHILGRISEDEMPLPVSRLGQARFRTAREAYYEVGAQVAHLAGARV